MNSDREADAIRQRYARRRETGLDSLYDPLRPSVYLPHQERERVLIRRILQPYLQPLDTRRLIEIGCGSGANLIHLLRLGFRPENLVANELLDERVEAARNLLPEAIEIIPGDATRIERPGAFDAVLLSTVFTSILDDAFQKTLADKAWELVKSGGGIIWYDFVFDNPANSDVRGVKLQRIKELFPYASIDAHRVTLAPPIARRITAIHPALYNLVNWIPLLRSHLLCWIAKP
ncbi:MAG: class I SAM-dependent methyltransferase [Gammaproteobacteria bacterium]|nr:class I SAM-dependent methyltransferase [Gammaproteobacteria bacterium]HXK55435.1 class I SAM-dependent methyltransferase [Gammaproteobacteria bacterium]